jgi:hypothetical protein
MLINCLNQNETKTNNNIESLHAHYDVKPTAILTFKQCLDRYINLFNVLVHIVNGNQIRYTLSPKRQRFLNNQNKRIAKEANKKLRKNKNIQNRSVESSEVYGKTEQSGENIIDPTNQEYRPQNLL